MLSAIATVRSVGRTATAGLAGLVVVNIVPLVGVLLLDWSVHALLVVYWLENGVVGLFSLLEIMYAASDGSLTFPLNRPEPSEFNGDPEPEFDWDNLGTGLFFCLHYGVFFLVHGMFVLLFPLLVGSGAEWAWSGGFLALLWFPLTVTAMVATRARSFREEYLGSGRFLIARPRGRMAAPYGRVVALHASLLVGAFLAASLNSPLPALLVLIGLKTGFDLVAFWLRSQWS